MSKFNYVEFCFYYLGTQLDAFLSLAMGSIGTTLTVKHNVVQNFGNYKERMNIKKRPCVNNKSFNKPTN